jgi:predicted Zn-dependent protease
MRSIHTPLSFILSISLCVSFIAPEAFAAFIKNGVLNMEKGENEDSAQCNTFVKVIRRPDGTVQVFYHDPDAGNKMVQKTVLAGTTMQISYWNNSGQRIKQVIRTTGEAAAPSIDSIPPAYGSAAAKKSTDTSSSSSVANTNSAGSSSKKSQDDIASIPPAYTPESKSKPETPSSSSAPIPIVPTFSSPSVGSTSSSDPFDTDSDAAPDTGKTQELAMSPSGMKAMPATSARPAITPVATNGDNFISATDTSLGPCAWKKFPVKVFIESAVTPDAERLMSEAKEAFQDWTRVTGNKIRFAFVSNKNADIVVSWVSSTAGFSNPKEAGNASVDYHTTGSGKKTLKSPGDISHANVKLMTKDIDHHDWRTGQLRQLALHEIGHSLGIFGHSNNPGDIMYHEKGATELSARDINTVNILYASVSGD